MKRQLNLAVIAISALQSVLVLGEDRVPTTSAPTTILVAGSGTAADADAINAAIAASPKGAEIVIRGK